MQLDQAWRQLNLVQDFIPAGSANRPGKRLAPTAITIHNTDNAAPGANAAAHARYVKGADARARQVSWHFTVDDTAVFQSLPTNEVGWHAGGGNATSIGIEICMHQGMDEQAAYERAALLTAVMARQHGISVATGVVQHHHWTGKNCPRVLRSGNGWTGFLQRVRALHGALRDFHAAEISLRDDDVSCLAGASPRPSAARSGKKPARKAARKGSARRPAKAARRKKTGKARKKTNRTAKKRKSR